MGSDDSVSKLLVAMFEAALAILPDDAMLKIKATKRHIQVLMPAIRKQ